ncbi:hypothetical protein LOC68_27590 [Blastopirellula sp. JC732]|uniref:Uncharacterized protein n=1 Tax=Blastopirellula sediminis TaxID=2894196 RepID=A0A9X1MSX3_9BACT|nr:hypothetical protein [Blastopirellula sediminis]MCC9604525.1 hypothetical protein [Blastopirellula sediminis]MCC9632176.1 hypothetical protein [Blastopirellula sediminis]
MGLFLSMSGVIGKDAAAVEKALAAFAAEKEGEFAQAERTIEDEDCLVLAGEGDRVSILYPSDFFDWDAASQYLSRVLSTPVFSFHIHDEDLWMYLLFRKGQPIDAFNPIPDYWDDNLSEEEIFYWSGNARQVAQAVPGVASEEIENYLKRWEDPDYEEMQKAYADDEFAAADCWQLLDFLKKLGFEYPITADGQIEGKTFRFACETKGEGV